MDRDQMLAEAGLDAEPSSPEPSAGYHGYGPLTVNIRSLPGQHSRLSLDLAVNGQVATGTWTEHASLPGYYSGSVYHGAIKLEISQTSDRMKGPWRGLAAAPGS